jgi:tetratricopeptide (TPR) repeat protein
MNRREAANVVRSFDATVVDLHADAIDWVVIGAEESPLAEAELLTPQTRDAAARGQLEVLCETELWQRLGLVDIEQSVRRYHTPAMLAHLLGVPVRVIRRWHRRGLITPVRTLHKLPYFDFQEVATARRLAQWIAAGASPQAIERRLVEWVEVLPNIQRPLDQLSVLIEGKHVLLRQGEGLLEPGGQMRFDFDALEASETVSRAAAASVLQMPDPLSEAFPLETSIETAGHDDLLESVYEAEEAGQLATAIDYCHAILARDGPRADICFLLGELLYRDQQWIAARERYYMAIELDPEFVEARASLAGVLAETGQTELAVAAYRGALDLHDDYPDAHYNLARVLDDLGRDVEARHHWKQFLTLSPDSPWAAEAEDRLSESPRP